MARIEIHMFIDDDTGCGAAGVRKDGALTTELSPHETMGFALRVMENFHFAKAREEQPIIQPARGSLIQA